MVIAAALVIASLAACGGDDTADSTAATTTEADGGELTGAARVTACTDAMNAAWVEANDTDDPIAAMDAAIDSEPLASTCDFFFADEFPANTGLSDEEAIAQIAQELDPALFDLLTTPVEVNFDEIGSEL